jgi:hypothetical protein
MEMVPLGLSTYQTHDTCMQNHPTHKKCGVFCFNYIALKFMQHSHVLDDFRYIRAVNPLIVVSNCPVRIVPTIFFYKSTFMRWIEYNIFNWHGVSLFFFFLSSMGESNFKQLKFCYL